MWFCSELKDGEIPTIGAPLPSKQIFQKARSTLLGGYLAGKSY
jgi:hypothetical protein